MYCSITSNQFVIRLSPRTTSGIQIHPLAPRLSLCPSRLYVPSPTPIRAFNATRSAGMLWLAIKTAFIDFIHRRFRKNRASLLCKPTRVTTEHRTVCRRPEHSLFPLLGSRGFFGTSTSTDVCYATASVTLRFTPDTRVCLHDGTHRSSLRMVPLAQSYKRSKSV